MFFKYLSSLFFDCFYLTMRLSGLILPENYLGKISILYAACKVSNLIFALLVVSTEMEGRMRERLLGTYK